MILSIYSALFAADKKQKRVLYLNSYHQSMTWAADITSGINQVLSPKDNNIILHIENMDTKRHNSKAYYESLANLYKTKYHNIKFDLILASDNNAFDFLKKYRNKLFGNIPVSFCGVNNYQDSMLKGHTNYTGIAEISSEVETVELILKLHPDVKNIFIINDYLKTGRAWRNTLSKNLEKFHNQVNIIHNENLSFEKLQEKVKSLSSDTVVLMGVYFTDKEGKYITYEKAGKFLLDISPVPVYTLTNFSISTGVIGGKVLTGVKHGSMMAKLGLSILQGMSADTIEVVKTGSNQFIFNHLALKKFDIDQSKLPKESLFINQTESFYQKYGKVTSIFLLLSVIVLAGILGVYYKKDLTNEKGVIKVLIYAPLLFIPTTIALLIFIILNNNQISHQEAIKDLKDQYIQKQKQITMNQIEEISRYIYKSTLSRDALLQYISSIQYGKNGYIFVLNNQGVMLAHPQKELLGTSVLEYTDNDGKYYVKQFIKNGIMNSLDFVEYQWENPETRIVDTKYTYVKYIPKHDFFIASGVYDQDIKTLTDQKTKELNRNNDKQVEQILIISVIVLVISTILSLLLSNLIKKIFNRYNKEIDEKNKNLENMNQTLQTKVTKEVKSNRKKDQLIFQQSKMASMGEMIGNIAHQWRQPLSVISTGATGIIAKKEFSMLEDDDLIQTCETINKNAQFLSQTIDDFKNYIKNDRQIVVFNLNENFQNLLSLLEGSIKNHNINVIVNIDESINLNGYPNELIQCHMNILNNSKDALQNIDTKKYIFIEAQKKDNELIIIIKDNAGGIPEHIIPKIFEPYFTTKHKSQGTGLGLNMTYNMIVDGMNGSIEVSNATYNYEEQSYKGAEFKITLPLN